MLTFTRVSTLHIEELMQQPDLLMELIQDYGFSVEDDLESEHILSLLESRWQGMEQTYSLENYAAIGQLIFINAEIEAKLLFSGGKTSPLQMEGKPIRVLSPLDVSRINTTLSQVDLMSLQQENMNLPLFQSIMPEAEKDDVDTFWMLLPGLFQFFQIAAENKECVIAAG